MKKPAPAEWPPVMESIFDILECSVCLERLDATSRILPCQHTFCLRCLTTILKTNNDLRCPECREPVPIRDVKELPTNILLVRILEGLKRPPRPPSGNLDEEIPAPTLDLPANQLKNTSSVFKPTQPFARAKFEYEAKETGDLSFNKGDIIFLKKKLDDHWYVGAVSQGQIGFFPANHVEVIQPLVEEVPKCKALYDFEVSQTAERDILTFNKDEVLKVIRRVDDNWVEGQKGERIGIFPISFVEFNDPAKSLIEQQTGEGQQGGSEGTNQGTNHSPQGSSSSGEGSTVDQAATGVTHRQSGNSNKTKSTTKRHSLSSVLGLQLRQKDGQENANGSNRHSMEISSPELLRSSNPIAATLLGSRQQGGVACVAPPVVVPTSSTTNTTSAGGSRRRPPPLAAVPQVLLGGGGSLPGSPSAVGPATSPRPNVEVFRARYSYKPQHPDELEVTAGEIFTAHEKCADGWFKGMSLSTGKVGVAPGNFMEPYRIEDHPPTSPGLGTSAFPLLAPSSSTSPQSASARSPNSALSATSQLSESRLAMSPPNAMLHQDCHKTVAQLQAEKHRQNQLLRGMTSRGSASGAVPRGNPSMSATESLLASRTNGADASGGFNDLSVARDFPSGTNDSPLGTRDIPSVVQNGQLGEPSIRHEASGITRQGAPGPLGLLRSGRRNLGGNKRPISSTGVPLSALERTLHDTSGLSPPENPARAGGYRRHGARGRSKSASRISNKNNGHSNSSNSSSSPEEGEGDVMMSSNGPRSQREIKEKIRRKSSSDPPQQGPPPPVRTTNTPLQGATGGGDEERPPTTVPLARDRYRVVDPYPAQSDSELRLLLGDVIFVHMKRDDGWYKGTSQRAGRTGWFPGIFVEKL